MILGLIHIVAELAARVRQDDEIREQEAALQAEKGPNLFQHGPPEVSDFSARPLRMEEESAPLLV